MNVGGEKVVYLIVEEVALLLSQRNELANLIKLIVKRQGNGLPAGEEGLIRHQIGMATPQPLSGGAAFGTTES
jgi:hypothetical protein